ncbi:MAG: Flagellar protein (FlbD) [Acidobacteria bacterium]|jgi:flagellar protein FlbD|nr:Flagellar protein (FlbD) [Acidobacteriota bacterium]
MISVTRLDGTPMIVNADQITWIEFMPDTVISLANGDKLLVREAPETIVERVRDFKRFILYGGRRAVRGPVPMSLTVAGDHQ